MTGDPHAPQGSRARRPTVWRGLTRLRWFRSYRGPGPGTAQLQSVRRDRNSAGGVTGNAPFSYETIRRDNLSPSSQSSATLPSAVAEEEVSPNGAPERGQRDPQPLMTTSGFRLREYRRLSTLGPLSGRQGSPSLFRWVRMGFPHLQLILAIYCYRTNHLQA